MIKNSRNFLLKVHKYLSLIIAIPMIVIFITGVLYAFRYEIIDAQNSWKFIENDSNIAISPSKAVKLAQQTLGSDTLEVSTISYSPKRAIFVEIITKPNPQRWLSEFTTLYIDPKNGEVLKIKDGLDGSSQFFTSLLLGHKYLWLPPTIGRAVTGWSVALFVFVIISGILLCFRKGKLKLVWKKSLREKHKVVAFYSSIIVIFCSLTGLIWSFESFSDFVYKISGGGETPPYQPTYSTLPDSSTQTSTPSLYIRADSIFNKIREEAPKAEAYFMNFPSSESSTFWCSISHTYGGFYKVDNLIFDQYSLSEIDVDGIYNGRYIQKNFAQKLRRMNFEIHDGRILGIAGRIVVVLATLASIYVAISGIILFFKRKKQ